MRRVYEKKKIVKRAQLFRFFLMSRPLLVLLLRHMRLMRLTWPLNENTLNTDETSTMRRLSRQIDVTPSRPCEVVLMKCVQRSYLQLKLLLSKFLPLLIQCSVIGSYDRSFYLIRFELNWVLLEPNFSNFCQVWANLRHTLTKFFKFLTILSLFRIDLRDWNFIDFPAQKCSISSHVTI